MYYLILIMMYQFITKISDDQHTIPLLSRCLAFLSNADHAERIGSLNMSTTVPRPPLGHFNLLYFASANTFTGKEFEPLPAPLPLRKLFALLEETYPSIRSKVLDSCLVTINLSYVDVPEDNDEGGADEPMIKEGDEVAIIPPVSSG